MAFNLADYETVDTRLDKWNKEYPDGRLETEIIEATDTRFIVICRLYKTEADNKACSTGLAMEVITDKGVNANFALPNCETSAIGRALANAGFSAKGKRPSREEMASVIRLQQAVPQTFSVDRTEPLPISNEDWVKAATVTPPKAPPPCCAKGHNLVTGVSKTNGKPYYGYLCLDRIKEHAVWAKQDSSGNWFFPDKGGD
jgi:hypothetical protein